MFAVSLELFVRLFLGAVAVDFGGFARRSPDVAEFRVAAPVCRSLEQWAEGCCTDLIVFWSPPEQSATFPFPGEGFP